MKTVRGWLPCILLLLALVGCQETASSTINGISFGPILKVDQGLVDRQVVVDGTLVSPSTAPIVVQRIRYYWEYNISWTAEEGTIVKKDDPIIKLDPSTIQKDLTDREISLQSAKLQLEEEEIRAADDIAQAKADIDTATFQLEKQELLVVNNDSVSLNERKKQQLEVASARKQLRRAKEKVENVISRTKRQVEVQKLKVKNAAEEVDEMRAGLDKMTLRAPDDGLLILPLYSTNSGSLKAVAGGGVRVNTVVAEVADPSDLVARVYVPEIDAEGIVENTPGTLALDIAPGVESKGHVKSISGVPSTPAEREGRKSNDPADNVRQFEVSFALDKLPPNAMPGMTVRVIIHPIDKKDVIRVPIETLALKPIDETTTIEALAELPQEGEAAYVNRQKDGKWMWHPVTVGAISLSHAEILSGLKDGDKIRSIVY